MQGVLRWSLRILGVVLVSIYIIRVYEEQSYDTWQALLGGLISFLGSFAGQAKTDEDNDLSSRGANRNSSRQGTKFFLFTGQLTLIIGILAIPFNNETGLGLILIAIILLGVHWIIANKIFSPSSTVTGASLAGIFILGVVLLFLAPYRGIFVLGYGVWCWWKSTVGIPALSHHSSSNYLPPRGWYLMVVNPERSGLARGYRFPLSQATTTIGCSPSNVITIESELVSERHAILQWNGSSWSVEDLRSVNKTFLQGQEVLTPLSIQKGDILRIGKFELMLCQ